MNTLTTLVQELLSEHGVSSRNGKNRTLSLRGSQQGKDNGARYCARVL